MKIDFFYWQSLDGWSVIVDNEIVGSLQKTIDGWLRFCPSIIIASNFPAVQHAEIQDAVANFITAQRITQRLTS